MRRIALPLIAPLAVLGLAACTTAEREPYQMAAADRERLDELLDGHVAGEPQSCLPGGPTQRSTVIDDRTLVYTSGSTHYLQQFDSGCSGLDQTGTAMVVEKRGGSSCEGDIVRLIDTATGMTRGACSFNEFIPYREAG